MDAPLDAPLLDPGRCRVLKTIGRGGFAQVYSVFLIDVSGEEYKAALKVLKPVHSATSASLKLAQRLFLSEAKSHSAIKHRNLVRSYGLFRVPADFPGVGPLPGPTWALVLEYCEGGTLRDRISLSLAQGRYTYSEAQALGWLTDVAEALHFLHTSQPTIIHRDVKAENVLLKYDKKDGRTAAKLADLGLHVPILESHSVMLRRRILDPEAPASATFVAITPAASEAQLSRREEAPYGSDEGDDDDDDGVGNDGDDDGGAGNSYVDAGGGGGGGGGEEAGGGGGGGPLGEDLSPRLVSVMDYCGVAVTAAATAAAAMATAATAMATAVTPTTAALCSWDMDAGTADDADAPTLACTGGSYRPASGGGGGGPAPVTPPSPASTAPDGIKRGCAASCRLLSSAGDAAYPAGAVAPGPRAVDESYSNRPRLPAPAAAPLPPLAPAPVPAAATAAAAGAALTAAAAVATAVAPPPPMEAVQRGGSGGASDVEGGATRAPPRSRGSFASDSLANAAATQWGSSGSGSGSGSGSRGGGEFACCMVTHPTGSTCTAADTGGGGGGGASWQGTPPCALAELQPPPPTAAEAEASVRRNAGVERKQAEQPPPPAPPPSQEQLQATAAPTEPAPVPGPPLPQYTAVYDVPLFCVACVGMPLPPLPEADGACTTSDSNVQSACAAVAAAHQVNASSGDNVRNSVDLSAAFAAVNVRHCGAAQSMPLPVARAWGMALGAPTGGGGGGGGGDGGDDVRPGAAVPTAVAKSPFALFAGVDPTRAEAAGGDCDGGAGFSDGGGGITALAPASATTAAAAASRSGLSAASAALLTLKSSPVAQGQPQRRGGAQGPLPLHPAPASPPVDGPIPISVSVRVREKALPSPIALPRADSRGLLGRADVPSTVDDVAALIEWTPVRAGNDPTDGVTAAAAGAAGSLGPSTASVRAVAVTVAAAAALAAAPDAARLRDREAEGAWQAQAWPRSKAQWAAPHGRAASLDLGPHGRAASLDLGPHARGTGQAQSQPRPQQQHRPQQPRPPPPLHHRARTPLHSRHASAPLEAAETISSGRRALAEPTGVAPLASPVSRLRGTHLAYGPTPAGAADGAAAPAAAAAAAAVAAAAAPAAAAAALGPGGRAGSASLASVRSSNLMPRTVAAVAMAAAAANYARGSAAGAGAAAARSRAGSSVSIGVMREDSLVSLFGVGGGDDCGGADGGACAADANEAHVGFSHLGIAGGSVEGGNARSSSAVRRARPRSSCGGLSLRPQVSGPLLRVAATTAAAAAAATAPMSQRDGHALGGSGGDGGGSPLTAGTPKASMYGGGGATNSPGRCRRVLTPSRAAPLSEPRQPQSDGHRPRHPPHVHPRYTPHGQEPPLPQSQPQLQPPRSRASLRSCSGAAGPGPPSLPLPSPVVEVSVGDLSAHMRRLGSITALLNATPDRGLPSHHPDFQWVYGLTGQAGSCMYMAPEVFLRQPYNEKCDVFGFGVLMYEVLNHELLLYSYTNSVRAARVGIRSPQDYVRKVSGGFRPPRPTRLSDFQWRLVSRCWHQDPCERPQMEEVLQALRGMMEALREQQRRRSSSLSGVQGNTAAAGRCSDSGDGSGSGGKVAVSRRHPGDVIQSSAMQSGGGGGGGGGADAGRPPAACGCGCVVS